MNNLVHEALEPILGPAAAAAVGMVATLAMGMVPGALYFAAVAVASRWGR